VEKKETNALFAPAKKNFGIGQAVAPKRDLTRYVKWPKYVRLQRQRRVLYQRMKVPPQIAQFNHTLDKNLATQLFKLLHKYKPEDKAAKKDRLTKLAAEKADGKETASKKPSFIKYGINHITKLVERKKASLVVIAHDVDPIELVLWLPALCRKLDVPYCIVKSKSRLGQVVGKKTATALAFTTVKAEDKAEFAKLVEAITGNFNARFEDLRKHWGGGIVGHKSQMARIKREKAIAKENASRDKAAHA